MYKKKRSSHNEKKLLKFLDKKKKDISPLLILTHDFPDPDALASAYALHFLASNVYHIRTRIVYKGIIGRVENRNMVNFLELPVHKAKAREIAGHEHVALVDTQPEFENNPFPQNRKATIIIDQHAPVNAPSADLTIIDTECGATSLILAKAILSLDIEIPERLATALAYGILTDTLNLYRARRSDIVETYMKILSFAKMHTLARIQIPEHDGSYFTTLSTAITKAYMRKGLMVCHIGKVKAPELVAQIAEYFLCYKKSEVVLVTGRFSSRLHASLRTKKTGRNAAGILRNCFVKPEDAGGHGQIAGGSVIIRQPNEKKWRGEEQRLEKNIVSLLKLNKAGRFLQPF
jgi:nanoRNase/pAp phosphatase (c-di-AMP/oligoRNAs hydrolase)